MVVIINYGMGNLHSVYTQCKRIGFKTLISSKKSEIIKADKTYSSWGWTFFQRYGKN